MMNFAGFSMKEFRRANDFSSKRRAQCLVPQTNSKDWKFPGKPLNQFNRDPCFLWRARSRRNHDALRFAPGDLFNRNFVVAMNFHIATQLPQILSQVVSKRIVVVEQQNHCFTFTSDCARLRAPGARPSICSPTRCIRQWESSPRQFLRQPGCVPRRS